MIRVAPAKEKLLQRPAARIIFARSAVVNENQKILGQNDPPASELNRSGSAYRLVPITSRDCRY